MLQAFVVLVALQLSGDLVADVAGLPIPGSVIGLLFLLVILSWRGRRVGAERAVPDALSRVTKGLHDHFGLLFVPAGAGVIANSGRFSHNAFGLLLTVLISTAVTIAVTALIVSRGGAGAPVAEATVLQ